MSNSGGLLHADDFVAAGAGPTADLDFAAPVPSLVGPTLYFCIPRNDKLLGYWDTVADRLFKIRHCMNIEGVVRQLPLFEPPIDPALLVQGGSGRARHRQRDRRLSTPPCRATVSGTGAEGARASLPSVQGAG